MLCTLLKLPPRVRAVRETRCTLRARARGWQASHLHSPHCCRYDAIEDNAEDYYYSEPGIKYCCVRDLEIGENGPFALRCATEMGFLSATLSRDVAVTKAMQNKANGGTPAVILRLDIGETGDVAAQGASLAAFSVLPNEYEVVYPPGTLLQYQCPNKAQMEEIAAMVGPGISVVDVVPVFA